MDFISLIIYKTVNWQFPTFYNFKVTWTGPDAKIAKSDLLSNGQCNGKRKGSFSTNISLHLLCENALICIFTVHINGSFIVNILMFLCTYLITCDWGFRHWNASLFKANLFTIGNLSILYNFERSKTSQYIKIGFFGYDVVLFMFHLNTKHSRYVCFQQIPLISAFTCLFSYQSFLVIQTIFKTSKYFQLIRSYAMHWKVTKTS